MSTFLHKLALHRKLLLISAIACALAIVCVWMFVLPLFSAHPNLRYVKPAVIAFPALITAKQSGKITVQPFSKSLDTSDPRTLVPTATTTYFTDGTAISNALYQQEVTSYNSEELKAAQGDASAEKYLEDTVYPTKVTVATTTYSALSVGDTVLVYTSSDANKSDQVPVTSIRILTTPTASPATTSSAVSIAPTHTSLASMLYSSVIEPLLTKIAFAGGATPHQGIMYFNGVWRSNVFWCDSGYTLTGFHDQAGNGNDLTWYACEGSNAPTEGLTASPSSISPGQSTTLTWTSTMAYSCSIDNGVNTNGATSGSVTVSPGSTTTYTVTCTDNVTSTSASATVTVLTPPTASLTANPTSIIQGQQQSVLTWSSTNATSCTVSNGVYSGGITSGALGTGLISNTTNYTLSCSGPGGTAYAYATVYVTPPSPNLYPGNPANVTVYAGQPATLSYSVINGGNATSGSFQDIFWIDNSSGNWASEAYTNAGPISPGASQYQSTTYTWNTPGTYVYTECVNLGGGGGPTYTCGNAGTVTVLTPLLPDITAATGSAVTGTVGVPFSGFTGRVYNIGTANATAFPNVFQICDGGCATVNTFINSQDFLLASGVSRAVTPSAGVSYTPTSVNQLYYRLCGDTNTSGNTMISESNYGNNCGSWQYFDVTAPDLQANAGASASGVVGQPIGLSGVVFNAGNASTVNGFYNNLQVTYSDQATVLANNVEYANAEAPGGSQGFTLNQAFPSAGTYYYRMCADENAGFQGTIQESNEGNNCSGWVPVYISNPSGSITANPNPCSITSGSLCSSTISWSANSSAVQVWISQNGGTAQLFANTSGGGSGSATAPWIAGPPNSYVFTLYDYSSGSRGATLGSVTVTALEANITAAAGPAATASYQQPTTLSGTITNIGSAATGAFPNVIQVCDGNCATVNTTLVATGVAASLNAGSSKTVTASYTPTSTNQLYYRICANENTSWQNVISESNYGDNCSGWQTLTVGEPDLTTANPPQNITTLVNQPFTMTNIVQNIGTAATPTGFPNSFWIDTNAIYNANDPWNTSAGGNIASLNAPISNTLGVGATQQISATYTISTPGTYYYAYCTDIGANWSPSMVFAESNTNNNCWGWGTITVTAPDLTATAGPVVTITPSQSQTFTATVTNTGNGATSGGFWNLLQVCNGSGSCSTYNDTTQESWVNTLAAGASSGISITDTGPSTPGAYSYRVCANNNTAWTNTVYESNYGNNCSSWQTLTVAYPPVAGSCSVSPTSAYTGQNVTWTASPTGGNGSYTYQWGASVSGTSQSVTTYYTSPGTYSGQVTVTSAGLSNTLYCSPGGTASPLTVNSCTPTLTASPSSITAGQSTTLTWSEPSACATSCTLSDGYSGGNTGSQVVTPPTNASTQTYAVTCNGNNGATNVNQASLNVAIPTATISASPIRVPNPGTSTISYTAQNVSSCEIYKNGVAWYAPSVSGGAASGSQIDSSITTQSTYQILCSSAGINATAQVIVNIAPSIQEF